MLQRIEAQVLFYVANDVNPGVATLIENDFGVEVLADLIDPYSSATWINTWTITELDDSAFFDRLQAIAQPFNADVLEAGLAGPPPTA